MADLTTDFIGIKTPNPFWLASAPPTDKEYNVRRAFEAGWGGVVWKTLGSEGPLPEPAPAEEAAPEPVLATRGDGLRLGIAKWVAGHAIEPVAQGI